jgi:hypothetical protein
MPALADITIKKNDGTTDITYVGQQPSSGDGTQAVWRATSVGTAPSHAPELRLLARDGDNGKKRALRSTYVYPQIATNTTTGITAVTDRASFDGNWSFSKGMDQDDINEFASQIANLIASSLFKACIKGGYSAS